MHPMGYQASRKQNQENTCHLEKSPQIKLEQTGKQYPGDQDHCTETQQRTQ